MARVGAADRQTNANILPEDSGRQAPKLGDYW